MTVTSEQLAAIERFEAGKATKDDVKLLLDAGLARPVDDPTRDEQIRQALNGTHPRLQLTAVARKALRLAQQGKKP